MFKDLNKNRTLKKKLLKRQFQHRYQKRTELNKSWNIGRQTLGCLPRCNTLVSKDLEMSREEVEDLSLMCVRVQSL